ncbi:hypothetical protein SAMN05444173_0775 [Opitutus sp. GAS368]|jgi:hypothetical protein|nr:hypothetical protein SAMN05444173_0775 [Opitutus sp. GAS368]
MRRELWDLWVKKRLGFLKPPTQDLGVGGRFVPSSG